MENFIGSISTGADGDVDSDDSDTGNVMICMLMLHTLLMLGIKSPQQYQREIC